MLIKPILIVHRYLGVVLGAVMTLWCLSGFVMMYQGYPNTTSTEREAGLEALNFKTCCALADVPLADDAPIMGLKVEMLRGTPVMRLMGKGGPQIFDLQTGEKVQAIDDSGAREIARAFAFGNGIVGDIKSTAQIKVDQWTVQQWTRLAPIWKVQFDNPKGSVVYVSGKTAEVVQDTNARERFLNWFGAIPHWLYPTILRQDGKLWNEVVIWASAAGTFLTLTGLIVGFVRLRYGAKRLFPYRRPFWLLHHIFGTFAGVLVLTWVFSGLLTMSPWGLFETPGTVSLRDFMGGIKWSEARQLIQKSGDDVSSGDVVNIRAAPLLHAPFVIVTHRDDRQVRIGLEGPEPLTPEALRTGLASIKGAGAPKVEVLGHEDDYYYSHHNKMKLPVFRVTFPDKDATRIYLDRETGEIRQMADATTKRYRWLESGLHDMDFAFLRARPVWDIVVLLLLSMVTAVCATGTWLAFARVGHDVLSVARALRGGRRDVMNPQANTIAPPTSAAGDSDPAATVRNEA
ncbi:MAG: PepSY domain-containing protein [Alphaproteobacteria bacterium]